MKARLAPARPLAAGRWTPGTRRRPRREGGPSDPPRPGAEKVAGLYSGSPAPKARSHSYRRDLDHLTALTALPETWYDLGPQEMIDSAASTLANMLESDLLYIGLRFGGREELREVAFAGKSRLPESALADSRDEMTRGDAPGGKISAPIGFGGSLIAAKSLRAGFPGATHRLLVTAAANAIANAIQRWDAAADSGRLASLVDRARDFIGVADMAGLVQYVNPAGLALVGLERLDPALPAHMFDFAASREREHLRDRIMPIVIARGRWIGEVELLDFRSGESIPALLEWFRIDHPRNGQPINFGAVVSDLRPHKRIEQHLREINEGLETRMAERAGALAEANANLDTAMDEQRHAAERMDLLQVELFHAARLSVAGQLAGTIAHELSQPLAAMLNSVNAARRLLASDASSADVALRELVEDAGGQAQRAGEIIRRLRYFIRRGSADRVPEQVRPAIEEAVAFTLAGPEALEVSVGFYFDPQAHWVLADRVQIQQVVSNLVRNALEAMENSGRRELTITTNALDGHLEVAVADTGSGVPERIRGDLFQPFMSTKPGGMGLGLSICRSIVEVHGGRIDYEPRKDGGSLFRFTLQVPPAQDMPVRNEAA